VRLPKALTNMPWMMIPALLIHRNIFIKAFGSLTVLVSGFHTMEQERKSPFSTRSRYVDIVAIVFVGHVCKAQARLDSCIWPFILLILLPFLVHSQDRVRDSCIAIRDPIQERTTAS